MLCCPFFGEGEEIQSSRVAQNDRIKIIQKDNFLFFDIPSSLGDTPRTILIFDFVDFLNFQIFFLLFFVTGFLCCPFFGEGEEIQSSRVAQNDRIGIVSDANFFLLDILISLGDTPWTMLIFYFVDFFFDFFCC